MNRRALILFFIAGFFTANRLSAFKHTDSSWVYYTAQQFANDERQNECACVIKEKAGPIWSWFSFDADGTLRSKEKSGSGAPKYYEPGSIYGFEMNGIRFRWIKQEAKYLAVLSDGPSLQLYIRATISHGFRTSVNHNFIVYRTNDSVMLKRFNNSNIEEEFKGNASSLKKMLSLLNALQGNIDYLNRRHFFKCRQIINGFNLKE